MVFVCGRLSTDLFARPDGDGPCIECALGTTYGSPHLCAILLCFCAGLWWPFVNIVNALSEGEVTARGRRNSALIEDVSSESDSGTGSRCSFFKAQEQRPPWLQQHSSAILEYQKLLLSRLAYSRKAYPAIRYHLDMSPLHGLFQHNRTLHERFETFADFDNGCIARQDVPGVC